MAPLEVVSVTSVSVPDLVWMVLYEMVSVPWEVGMVSILTVPDGVL